MDRRIACSSLVLTLSALVAAPEVLSQSPGNIEKSRDNLMAVLRESKGANKPTETLVPTGKVRARLADGREIEMEMSSFEFIGDMHIRLVFDGPNTMLNATPADLHHLGLSTEEALRVAVTNIKRAYGEPAARPWTAGLMQVQGKSPDLDSSYFLDHEFWNRTLQQHPEGLVVAVPKRGGLLYVPLSNESAVAQLRRGISRLHATSERLRVSSALYLFKEGKWSVFQAPDAQ